MGSKVVKCAHVTTNWPQIQTLAGNVADLAQLSRSDQLAKLHDGCGVQENVTNEYDQATCRSDVDQFLALPRLNRQRLFDKHMQPSLKRLFCQPVVRGGRSRNHYTIKILASNHLVDIVVTTYVRVTTCNIIKTRFIQIANRNDFAIRNAVKVSNQVRAPVAYANNANFCHAVIQR